MSLRRPLLLLVCLAACASDPLGERLHCPDGFLRQGRSCADVDECRLNSHDCDARHGTCTNTEGAWECSCATGWAGDGRSCWLVADCRTTPALCDPRAACTEVGEDTVCVCPEGWLGDGGSCYQPGFDRVVAGSELTCGLKADGSMWCWGYRVPGRAGGLIYESIAPAPLAEPSRSTWLDFDNAGLLLGVKQDGTLWSYAGAGFTQIGTDADWSVARRSRSIFNGFACGLKSNGTRWCWGDNGEGQLGDGTSDERVDPVQADAGTDWATLALGDEHGCGIKSGGTLWCWGSNLRDQLGVPGLYESLVPVQVGADADWAQVAAYYESTCAVKTDGSAWCWGRGVADAESPARFGDAAWRDLSLGFMQQCGVRLDGSLWCWGSQLWGERGSERFDWVEEPEQVGTERDWSEVTTGLSHTCARKVDRRVFCFGHNFLGQLGLGRFAWHLAPVVVEPGSSWQDVALGQAHTCGIRADGSMACWGSNQFGFGGYGEVLHTQLPTAVGEAGSRWRAVTASIQHTCGVQADRSLWCWGFGGGGQTGLGSGYAFVTVPTRVGADLDWDELTTGPTWSLGRRSGGTLWGWGQNTGGQLGTGGTEQALVPGQVGADTDWASVGSSGFLIDAGHTCGVRADGTLWCWGKNDMAQLGDGSTTDALAPARIGADADWQLVRAGAGYTCAIKQAGTLWCWGAGHLGRLGLGPTSLDVRTPTEVAGGAVWRDVRTAYMHTCAVRTDGTLWCWGDPTAGVLGDGRVGYVGVSEPQQVGTDTDWRQVDVDQYASCAVKEDDSLWCWGVNRDGQLGVGGAWYTTPQPVLD